MAATIREIAQRLNLSHTTVSRVLNNRSNAFISEETRERVLAAAREMHYLPNLAARSLRDSRTNMVGLFGSGNLRIDTGLVPDIIAGARGVLHANHLDVFFAFSPSDEEERRYLPAWRYDGAIVLQSPNPTTLQRLEHTGLPAVAVNELLPQMPCVLSDDRQGMRLALDHLGALGHRRIAYINAEEWQFEHYSVLERQSAYLDWLGEHGLIPVPGYEQRPHKEDCLKELKEAILEHGATAVVAYDHMVAVDVLTAAQTLGLRVPLAFSLITFNDAFPVSRLAPPLTVVAPSGSEMGAAGARLLLCRLSNSEEEVPAVTRIPESLVVRSSTAAAGR